MTLMFTQKEFDKLRTFQDRMTREFGETAYVGANSATILVNYSPQLTEMLRPFANINQFEYELSQLTCENCKKKTMFLSVPGETIYICNDCFSKKKTKK